MNLLRLDMRLVLPLLGTPGVLMAQSGPIVTDRPDRTESAVSVRRGSAQLETGWSFARANGQSHNHALGESLLRVGVVNGLEARLGFAGWQREWSRVECFIGPCPPGVSSGFGDLEIGMKYVVAEERGRRPQFAVIAMTTLPTGERGFGSNDPAPTLRLAFSDGISDKVSVAWNVGAFSVSDGSQRRWDALYTLTTGIGLADKLGMFVEVFGTLGVRNAPENTHNVDGGFTFQLRDNLQFDVAGGVGLNGTADDWFVGAGLSVRIPR